MAVKFLEPGGDADFAAINIWNPTSTGAVATDFVHGGHLRSIAYAVNSLSASVSANGTGANPATASDAGGRMSFFIYINALPNATASFFNTLNVTPATVMRLRLTSAGVLQLFEASVQVGSNGPTLSTGTWYRISFAYTISSTTVNRFEVFVDGVSAISVTNATITNTGTANFEVGNTSSNLTFDFRSSDHYADDSNALIDPGNIWVTAKRPVSNGTSVQFTTQIGAGGSGYGSGHTPQVNERPLSTTNGWSISTTTVKTEEYTIEAQSVGDINIAGSTIIDFMGWMTASVAVTTNSPVQKIIVAGVSTTKTLTTSAATYFQMAGSSTYPTGNTDIGISSQFTTTARLASLFECGIIVAYIPSVPVVTPAPRRIIQHRRNF